MDYKERKKVFDKLGENYKDLVWKPQYVPLMRTVFPFLRNFKVNIKYEEELPTDGVYIFLQNHCNFYDSMIIEKALRGHYYCCFASDEPRGTIQGMGFEATGVVWLKRDSKESRKQASKALIDLLKNNCNLSWCPEGLWGLSENKLLLHLSRGLAKAAIAGSNYNKVYIVPVITNYNYKDNSKVESADVTICKSILVDKTMDDKELTEYLEDVIWTERWNQMEEAAKRSNLTIPYDFEGETYYLYPKDIETKEKWDKHIEKLKAQLTLVDWEKEAQCEIKTKEQKLQEEMESFCLKIKRK